MAPPQNKKIPRLFAGTNAAQVDEQKVSRVLQPKALTNRAKPYSVDRRPAPFLLGADQTGARHQLRALTESTSVQVKVAKLLEFVRKHYGNFLAHRASGGSETLNTLLFRHSTISPVNGTVSVPAAFDAVKMFSDAAFLSNFKRAFGHSFPAAGYFRTLSGEMVRCTFDLQNLQQPPPDADSVGGGGVVFDYTSFKTVVCLFWGLVFDLQMDGMACACFPESHFELFAWNEALNLNCFKRSCQTALLQQQSSAQTSFTGPCFVTQLHVAQASIQASHTANVFINTLFGDGKRPVAQEV
jgi:hypothetical protein